MKRFILLLSLLIISFSLGVYISNQHYQPQIEGLTKQLERTQKQLSKKTKLIAELTGNGG